jgi:hypothetical protein
VTERPPHGAHRDTSNLAVVMEAREASAARAAVSSADHDAPALTERISRKVRASVDRSRKLARPLVIRMGRPAAAALAGRPPKQLSAMFRVRNEEEFLEAAVTSVVDVVDEVVIVDNGSTDATPRIIADLVARHPARIRTFQDPHSMARYGAESVDLLRTRTGRRSPSFLPTYYNWCLERCTHPYILKWDGDTVATSGFAATIERFRTSRSQVLWYSGINLHEDRRHLISGRPYEDVEPRLFYRRFARYNHSLGYVETLWSPYMMLYPEFSERLAEPQYFHLKFCKRDRFTNISADLRESEIAHSSRGEQLPAALREQVVALGL